MSESSYDKEAFSSWKRELADMGIKPADIPSGERDAHKRLDGTTQYEVLAALPVDSTILPRAGFLAVTQRTILGSHEISAEGFEAAETKYNLAKRTARLMTDAPNIGKMCASLGMFARSDRSRDWERHTLYYAPPEAVIRHATSQIESGSLVLGRHGESVKGKKPAVRFVIPMGAEYRTEDVLDYLRKGEVPIYDIFTVPAWLSLPPELIENICIGAARFTKSAKTPVQREQQYQRREQLGNIVATDVTPSGILDIAQNGAESLSGPNGYPS